jgi:hypothetical protein
VGGIGFGLIYPVLVDRIAALVPAQSVARAISVFTVLISLGVFLCPYFIRAVGHAAPGFMTELTFPLLVSGAGLLGMAGVLLFAGRRVARRRSSSMVM